MTYDLKELYARIKRKRCKFIVRSSALLIAAMVCIGLIFAFSSKNDNVVFISSVGVALSFVFEMKLISRFSPATLFSNELRGENVREDEYVAELRYNTPRVYRRINYPDTRANSGQNRRSRPLDIRSSVYLKLADGDIKEIRGLKKRHTDIYEVGDTLFKPRGTKYLIVEGRHVSIQPCPFCGEINTEEKTACSSCRLPIIKT